MVDDEGSNSRFDILLTWLNPNREKAWEKYHTIQETLFKIFTWRGCRDAEDLALEVINRVEQKMPGLIEGYEGDPARYFYGVAKNVAHESHREDAIFSEFQEDDAAAIQGLFANDDKQCEDDEREQYLPHCLGQLSDGDRNIILSYYGYDEKTKLADRRRLAGELGVTMNALWIRVSRIRSSLGKCIKERLNQKGEVQ